MLSSTWPAISTDKINSTVKEICKIATEMRQLQGVFEATLQALDADEREVWGPDKNRNNDHNLVHFIAATKCRRASQGSLRMMLRPTEVDQHLYTATVVLPANAFPQDSNRAIHSEEFMGHFWSRRDLKQTASLIESNLSLDLSPSDLALETRGALGDCWERQLTEWSNSWVLSNHEDLR